MWSNTRRQNQIHAQFTQRDNHEANCHLELRNVNHIKTEIKIKIDKRKDRIQNAKKKMKKEIHELWDRD